MKKEENRFKSDQIKALTYQQKLHASMKQKVYKVRVSCYSLHDL